MRGILQQVLGLKSHREVESASEVRQAQYKLEEAANAVSRARRKVEEYRAWRIRREDELYDSIIDQHLKVRDLDDLKEQIGLLRQEEQVLRQRLSTAEDEHKKAADLLIAAQQSHRSALKEKEKIQILWDEEQKRESLAAAHAAESEMEEFAARGRRAEEQLDNGYVAW